MGEVQMRVTGVVIPFPSMQPRRTRAETRSDEPRGELLLFTGVRYERIAEPAPEPSPAIDGRTGSGRRRRRS